MSGRQWTPRDVALLRELYPHHATAHIAAVFGYSIRRVYAKASAMGLHKTDEFHASHASGRLRSGSQHPRMVASRFQPGMVPWNKGIAFNSGGRSAETHFKPGITPHNTLPLGSVRINKDGTLERKVSEARGNANKRWRAVAELVWIAEYGPVPAGHIVIFRPGMRTTVLEEITPDRVECISRAENARRNHPRSKHPELARLVQLKGAITRQVNRIHREAQEKAATP